MNQEKEKSNFKKFNALFWFLKASRVTMMNMLNNNCSQYPVNLVNFYEIEIKKSLKLTRTIPKISKTSLCESFQDLDVSINSRFFIKLCETPFEGETRSVSAKTIPRNDLK